MAILLNQVNVNTNGDAVTFDGGFGIAVVRADDFGGGTVSIEARSVNDTGNRWEVLPSGAFTTDDTKKIEGLVLGLEIRATLTSATSPSNVFVEIL